MKKILLIAFIFYLDPIHSFSQSITEQEWNSLVQFLDNEKWDSSANISWRFLKRIEKDTNYITGAAILRYMHITSLAGMMNDDRKLSQEDAIKKVKGFEGLPVMLPVRMLSKKMGFNYYNYNDESDSTLHCTNSNKKNIAIFSFDKITLAEPLDKAKYEGKYARVGGYLKEITVEGLSLPRFRLIIVDAFIELDE
jgi:hypothetical protein